MKGEALNTMARMVQKLRQTADQGDRHGFLDTRAELERVICERSFSPRLAHLFEVMAYPSARYRAFHVSVPGYMEEVARCYEGIYQAFSKGDEVDAERFRLRVMEVGRELLRRYFIEPHEGFVKQEQRADHL
jgi:DNA-binding GntR family transcriptional regulator